MTDVTNTDAPTGFDALKGLGTTAEAAPEYTQKLDAQGRAGPDTVRKVLDQVRGLAEAVRAARKAA